MNTPRQITSLQNDRIKAIRALEMRKVRRETGLFVAEGASILVTARDQGHQPRTLAYQAGSTAGGIARGLVWSALEAGAEVLEVTEAILGKIASKDNPQSMLGVFEQRWIEPPSPEGVAGEATWLALEEVRDPGNLGTIIRTAHAVGAAGLLLVGNCCDPYSRECVRATMGSIFAVPVARMTHDAFLDWRPSWPGDVVGTHLAGTEDFRRVEYRAPVLLVMGSEGPGLSAEMAPACSRLVRIPMAPGIDSLNLAVATALALYQVRAPFLKP